MTDDLVYVPGESDSFVPLSRTSTGRLFKKHILSKGTLYYPGVKGGKVEIDDEFLTHLSENFEKKVCPIVQTPVVGDNNAHSEDPFRNIGEVVDLKIENGKAYAYIDARDEVAAAKLGKTLLGASAMLSLDYTDTKTGTKAGPALLHVAITNRPHLTDLDDFEEVLAASASNDSNASQAIILSATNTSSKPYVKESLMDLDEFIAVGKEEHGIDIPALQRAAAEASNYAKLSGELQKALTDSGILRLSAGEESTSEDIVAAVTNIMETNVRLSADVDSLKDDAKKTKAEARVDELIRGGFIAPVKREANLKLLLSNPESFEELLPEKPIVELSAEAGNEQKDDTHDVAVDEEIARLSAAAEKFGYLKA